MTGSYVRILFVICSKRLRFLSQNTAQPQVTRILFCLEIFHPFYLTVDLRDIRSIECL